MNTPHPALLRHYGNEDVFKQKTAGGGALLAGLAAGVLNAGLAHSNQESDEWHRQQAEALNEAFRELELSRMRTATGPLRGEVSGASPTQYNENDYPGFRRDADALTGRERSALSELEQPLFKAGMTRLASLMAGAGADLAKEAGLMAAGAAAIERRLPGVAAGAVKAAPPPGTVDLLQKGVDGVKGRLGMGFKANALVAGGAVGATILGSKAVNKTTQVMGREAPGPANFGSGGYQAPYGVNAYGQPQQGTSL